MQHHGRTTEKTPLEMPSPSWWGRTIAGLAGSGFVALMIGAVTGVAVAIVAGLGACAAALLMAMRWR